ncbi:MAG: DNA polymerase IV [bacterium]|nr:DNA polymerase IV [bacterium]
MAKVIMHIDLNAFFASCEVIRDPSLSGLPLLIGHSGRSGIVSTASYEARKFGCHSGQPMFQALRLCPQAKVIPVDFDYYSMMSLSFFSYLRRYTPLVEPASIDEGYADMTERLKSESDPASFFLRLQSELKKETGLSCSIGVAPTKWLAKMASDLRKPMGMTILRRKDIPLLLYPLPIESFWGIGKKTSPRLREMGIQTIGDFAQKAEAGDPALRKELGKFFATAKEWVEGGGSDQVSISSEDPKSIGAQETLPHDCREFEEVAPYFAGIAEAISSRAKKERKEGKGISVNVKTLDFRLHSKATLLDSASNDPKKILEKVKPLFLELMSKLGNPEIRQIGITLTRLIDPRKETVQMSLWNYEEYEKKDATKLLIESLNRKMDKPMLKRASQAEKKEKPHGNKRRD